MKHIFLITSFLLSIIHTSHAMELTPRKNAAPSYATQKCLAGIQKGNLRQLEAGLFMGANVNYTNSDGKSLFCLACDQDSNISIFKALITHEDIDINSRSLYNITPLHVACELGLTTTIQSMLYNIPQAAFFFNLSGSLPLHTASYYGQKECVALLLSHNINTINHQDYSGNTPLHLACQKRKWATIRVLIGKDANPTIKDNEQTTPLTYLFSVDNNVVLLDAFFANNPHVAKELIHRQDIHKNSQLHLCTTSASIIIPKFELYLQYLISRGLNIDSRNKDNKRAIDLTCEAYNAFYNQYSTLRLSALKTILTNQERVMHCFLRVISPYTRCVLFKHILEQQSSNDQQLPKELMVNIASFYYALNIETIVAKKYNNSKNYYAEFIGNKNRIRQQLRENPEPKLLWSA